jgi:RimJ/RimL family protein N-acetyltransferase
MMIVLGPTIETERLILRPPVLADFDALVETMATERSAKFIGGVMARAQTWRSFVGIAGAWALQGFSMFSVIEKASGAWVGRIGPHRPEGWPGDEVGWGLHPDHFGKGYALEAATASMDYAVDVLGWTDIIHCIDPDNEPSWRLAMKLGSTNRGPGRMPAPFEDSRVDLWGQTADVWRARRAAR